MGAAACLRNERLWNDRCWGAKRSFDEAGGLLYLLDRLRGLTTIERC
jgi:hypothetical protein